MDKYLSLFTQQLDAKFNPETIFPEQKKIKIREWLKRNFTIRKYTKKRQQEKPTVGRGELKYV